MRQCVYIMFATITAFAGCRHQPEAARDEGAILAVVLDSLYFQPGARIYLVEPGRADPEPFLAASGPVGPTREDGVRRALMGRGLPADLVANFVSANVDASPIAPPRAQRLPVVLNTVPALTDAGREAFLRAVAPPLEGKGFDRYTNVDPGAKQLISFSHVGLSRDGARALVYVQQECGMLCAAGSLVTLRQSGGRWHIERLEQLWTS